MRNLVVFYSRTGNTRKLGQEIAALVDADVEELIDTKNRKGIIGYLVSGRDAHAKKRAELKKIEKDPSQYNIIIIGTPVWAQTMCTPIRTYIDENKGHFRNIAFFCTAGSSDTKYAISCFNDMEALCGKRPVALLGLGKKEIKQGYTDRLRGFASAIQDLESGT